MRPDRPRAGEAGFSLIEVVVALALLGLVLGVLTSSLRGGLTSAARSAAIQPPLAVAEARLAEAGVTEPLSGGVSRGTDARGIGWQRDVEEYRDDGYDGPSQDAPGVPKLYRVRVTVTWEQGGGPRSLTLETLRLGRATP